MKVITITIDEKGESTVDAAGFHGKGCKLATLPYEDALGVATAMTLKPEATVVQVRPEVRRA